MLAIPFAIEPNRSQLRVFALLLLMFCFALGAWVLWRQALFLFDLSTTTALRTAYTLWVTGALTAALGLMLPQMMKPVFITLSCITYPIGWLISLLVLAFIFYVLITPLALVFKARGRDLLQLDFAKRSSSYWIARAPKNKLGRYYRQF